MFSPMNISYKSSTVTDEEENYGGRSSPSQSIDEYFKVGQKHCYNVIAPGIIIPELTATKRSFVR